MIIMLNGSFGVGKTSIAQKMLEILPNTMLFDPEEVGQMVRIITRGVRAGSEDTDDFQDISLWRVMTIETARQLLSQYNRTLIVPMTLANPLYFEQIKMGFATFETRLYHFCLTASVRVIHQRLLQRGDNSDSWCWAKTLEYAPLFMQSCFEIHIDTENHSLDGITQKILDYLPVN